MKAASRRLDNLKARLSPSITVYGIDEPWGELDESYQFYLEHSPATTGCSWEEYFYKQRDAGFYPPELNYQEHKKELGQW